jgi:5-methylcytosine-specific restriction endonuclease McrA
MNYLHIEPYKTILVLNMDYNPINFTNWKRAVVLLLKEKAQVLSSRVIRLVDYVKIPLNRIMIQKPTRALIYQRDDHTCQYCGSQKRLTIDHIVPRSRGGQDTWENMVVACSPCNVKKGNTLLEQTGMKLKRVPKAMENKITLKLNKSNVTEWKSYIY